MVCHLVQALYLQKLTFRKLARGDTNVLEYVKEIAEELSEKIF